MKSFFRQGDHGTFHYEMPEHNPGKLPIAVFLHGGSTRSQHTKFWGPILEIIQRYCYPLLTDRFGHGKSTGTGGLQANLEVMDDIVGDILSEQEQSQIYLVGRSAGAMYAMRMYESDPDRIAGMGLVAPASLGTYADKLSQFDGILTLLWDIDDPVVSFSNYSHVADHGIRASLYTIGPHPDAVASASRELKPSHVPELMAPELFDAFLKQLLS